MHKFAFLFLLLSFKIWAVDPRTWCNMANSGREGGIGTVYLTSSAKAYDVEEEDEQVYRAHCKDLAADLEYIKNTPAVCVGLERGSRPYALDGYSKIGFDPSYCLSYKVLADYRSSLSRFFNPSQYKGIGNFSYSKKALKEIMKFMQGKCRKERGKPLGEYHECVSVHAHKYFTRWGKLHQELMRKNSPAKICKVIKKPSLVELTVFNSMRKKGCPIIDKNFRDNFCGMSSKVKRTQELSAQIKDCFGDSLLKASDDYPTRNVSGLNRTPLLTNIYALDSMAQKLDMHGRVCHSGLRFNAPFDQEVKVIPDPKLKEYCMDDTYQKIQFARSFSDLLQDKAFLKLNPLEKPDKISCELTDIKTGLPTPVDQDHMDLLRNFATGALSRDPNRRPEPVKKVSKLSYTEKNLKKTIGKALISLSKNKTIDYKNRALIGALVKNSKYLDRTAKYYYEKYKYKKIPGERKLELALNEYGKALLKTLKIKPKKSDEQEMAVEQKTKPKPVAKAISKKIAEFKIPEPSKLAETALEEYRKGKPSSGELGSFILARDKMRVTNFLQWQKKLKKKDKKIPLEEFVKKDWKSTEEMHLAFMQYQSEDPQWKPAFEMLDGKLEAVLYNRNTN